MEKVQKQREQVERGGLGKQGNEDTQQDTGESSRILPGQVQDSP